MSATFDFFSIKTVPSTYSWDVNGLPRGTSFPFVTDSSLLTSASNNSQGVEYFGYAPFVSLSLSSSVGTISPSAVAVRRVTDFGDYYNSESNLLVSPTLSNEAFCHNYIMPGLYSIKMTQTEYLLVETQGTAAGCVYIQPLTDIERFPLSWQWYNFLCESPSPYNTPVTWSQAEFQQPEQLVWSETNGPCYALNASTSQTSWIWNNVTCNLTANPLANSTKWDDTKCDSPLNTRWEQLSGSACQGSTTQFTLSATSETFTKELYLRVLEIPPKCYLAVQSAPSSKVSPYTVQLTPRYTRCGSFPIEKIVWDLGDGSPLLVQRRASINDNPKFVYTNRFNTDWKDPRNYDIVHTYNRTSRSQFSFYPSITAYTSSTSTSDCASIIIGPLSASEFQNETVSILQNELTDHGKVLIGEVSNSVALWSINK